jgi:protein-S-isoprenylcysteine O-methyltransferase Ste14
MMSGAAVTRYFAVLTILLMIGLVLTRLFIMKRSGVHAMHFGQTDKTDYFIPPVALFYFYLIFAAAFGWPVPTTRELFDSEGIRWLGVALCLAGVTLLAWSLASFEQSFRVGIDTERPDKLVTTGVFSLSRNPIYVGFALILLGQFLIFSGWFRLAFLVAGYSLLHRQVLREEEFLRERYGRDFEEYRQRVRRYV